MSVYDDTRAMFPELGGLTDSQMAPWLPVAQVVVGVDWYGDVYSSALAMSLAHFITRAFAASGGVSGAGRIGGAATGPVTSASNRAASEGRAAPIGSSGGAYINGSDADLMSTGPGQQLRALRDAMKENCAGYIV